MRHTLERRIDQALGRAPADLVIRNARILDLATGALLPGDIAICGDTIVGTCDTYRGTREIDANRRIAVPGFIDTHVHTESTLVTPGEFDRCVLPRGTTTAICDPHEISNVFGEAGLRYVLDSALHTVMDLRVQLSSCVPATTLETSGATLDAADLVRHRDHPKVIGLAEFMNVPGVLNKDPDSLDKIAAFTDRHIDGHAPLLSGRSLNAYRSVGICNCHESTNATEGREKLQKGLQLLIREGTVSKDLAALAPLIDDFASPFIGFCTDDRNPLDIHEEGHLDHLVRRAIALGAPIPAVYRIATWSAARGFGLRDRGLIAPGFLADILLLDDLATCAISTVFRRGQVVTPELFGHRTLPTPDARNSILLKPTTAETFAAPAPAHPPPSSASSPARSSPSISTPTCPIATANATPIHHATCSKSVCSNVTDATAMSAEASSKASACAPAPSPPPSVTTATTSASSAPATKTWPARSIA